VVAVVQTTPTDLVLNGTVRVLENPFRQAPSRRAFGPCGVGCYTTSPVREQSLPTAILSTLTSYGEGVQSNNIRSITLRRTDASKFFARYRFSNCGTLISLTRVTISSRKDLELRTTALTPYLSQSKTCRVFQPHLNSFRFLPQILTQSPTLSEHAISCDDGGRSTVLVLLRHLKLSLTRNFHLVFQLLRRLDHSRMTWLCSIAR